MNQIHVILKENSYIIGMISLFVTALVGFANYYYTRATYEKSFEASLSIDCDLIDPLKIKSDLVELTYACELINNSSKPIVITEIFSVSADGPRDTYTPRKMSSLSRGIDDGVVPINLSQSEVKSITLKLDFQMKESVSRSVEAFCKDVDVIDMLDYITECANLSEGRLFDTFDLWPEDIPEDFHYYFVFKLGSDDYFIDSLPNTYFGAW